MTNDAPKFVVLARTQRPGERWIVLALVTGTVFDAYEAQASAYGLETRVCELRPVERTHAAALAAEGRE